ncbi:PREDICTED: solanesyl diphosphate synthase 3, chloroplastic/mitochondrial-like [Tarenaya hassleriana]|uniref:solanesyl diphosphate synthase 3, chloroplastic/mitochondrial-like n=1 Tax=Tarenaya hassleriana TaxID=28532 RepID=UPI00053C6C5E|nr:PREDICTED: solanesyl diphosphate synthase 3, chloroplastic/mitochondrial-like [Tarenaya hassleriana]
MLFSRGFSRISSKFPRKGSFFGCPSFLGAHRHIVVPDQDHSRSDPTQEGFGCGGTYSWRSPVFGTFRHQFYHQSSSLVENETVLCQEELDPFSLVADELSLLGNKLRAMVVAEVPSLASAAEYFFKMGVEGKRFRPTVLLLMATALNVRLPEVSGGESVAMPASELRARQQRIAEITEMIHVASLLHDDVLDDADTRRGIGSLNLVMGNKISVLAGDFLLSRACVALASLKNTEVVSLIATVVEHLVTGETMQMTSTSEQRHSMNYYMQKTYYKTASLISNSCKSIAILAGQTTEVAMLAFEYGKNLGLAYQLIDDVLDFTGTSTSLGKGSLSDIRHGIITAPILFAMEEYPQLSEIVHQGFDNPANINIALEYLGKSRGIQRTRELALEHANLAAAAIGDLPETDDEDVKRCRRALIDITHRVITRNK